MSLAVDYRPNTFDDVVEQDVVVNILRNICNTEKLQNRNFLLVGPAGTGKTTLGRIITNSLNGESIDPIEIDAASHNGIDDVRDIIEQASQFPVVGKYKCFIIDECHAMSNSAWQAMLKMIEEPPAASVFIFCTTNPEKIPATIISRVQTFRLSKISTKGIFDRMIEIIKREQQSGREITYDPPYGVIYIAKMANGGMRDALTMLDKCLAFSSDLKSENVVKALGLPGYDDYFDLLRAVSKRDFESLLMIIDVVYNRGDNFVAWFEGFNSFLVNVIKYCYFRDFSCVTIPESYAETLSKYTEAHAKVCMKLSSVVTRAIHDMRQTSYQQETIITALCELIGKKG